MKSELSDKQAKKLQELQRRLEAHSELTSDDKLFIESLEDSDSVPSWLNTFISKLRGNR